MFFTRYNRKVKANKLSDMKTFLLIRGLSDSITQNTSPTRVKTCKASGNQFWRSYGPDYVSFKFDQSPSSTRTVTIARQLKLSLTRGCLGCIIHFIYLNIPCLTTKGKLKFEI